MLWVHQPRPLFAEECTETKREGGLGREGTRAPGLRSSHSETASWWSVGPGSLFLRDVSILYTQARSPWGPVSWLWLSTFPCGDMIPPSRPRSLVTGSQALRWGEGLDSQPTPTASTFLCSCVFSPPPIWLPPSPLQELSLPRTLLLATLRSVPLNLLGLPLTPAFLAPCATPHSCPPPVSAGLPAPLWPLPGPTWLGALVLLFLGHPGSGL